MNNIIPPITDPMGKSWNQPSLDRIEVGDEYATLSKKDLDSLPEYSSTLPSGVYPGKMWKRHDGVYDPVCKVEDRKWLLCWFGEVPGDPNKCSINHRSVLLKNMLDLLTS